MRYLAMINVVAVCLVLSTLAAAGVWSPAPPPHAPAATQQHGEQVVRESRRVVIVEYEREVPLNPGDVLSGKETHVLPPHVLDGVEARDLFSEEAGGLLSDTVDRVAGAAEDGKEKLSDAKESAAGKVFGAVKRCKDKLCGAAKGAEEGAKDGASRVKHGAENAVTAAGETLSGAKETVEEKVVDAASEAKETAKSARDKVSGAAAEAMDKASHIKDGAAETAKSAAHKVSEAAGGAKEKASQVKDGAAENLRSAKGKLSEAAGGAKEKASQVKDGAAENLRGAKGKVSEAAKNAKNTAKEAAIDAKDKVSDMAGRAEEYAHDAAGKAAQAEEVAKAKAGEVTKNMSDIARRARDVASDAAVYLLGAPMEAARTATAVMHLLGFATAYGSCVWVTFVSSHVLAAALPRQQLGMVQSKLYPVYFRAVAYGVGLALAAHLLGREQSSIAARAQSLNLLGALALVLANMLLLEPKATKVMFERKKVEKEEGRGRDMADIVDTPVVTVATTAPPTNPVTRTVTPTAATTTPTRAVAARTPVDRVATANAVTAADAEMAKSRVVRLNQRLKQLNGYSSLCNVLTLMALTWHLVHLARRLQVAAAGVC